MPNILFDPTIEGLARTLTLHQQRHAVLASNLANVETPGYRARELDFQDALRQAFEETGAGAGEHVEGRAPIELESTGRAPLVVEDKAAPRRADGNTVDLDMQMAKLNANGTSYLALARILGRRVALLRQAIDGTR
ncbi:MAG: flagellar basal body rod protein FlgB [Deltaproteobacteria bacterium]|nr:MAG: flagellar basal body rod protein FlgB [Deltaproteobacteria bacterium]